MIVRRIVSTLSFLVAFASARADEIASTAKSMDPGHAFFMPTALQKPEGSFAMKGYYLGLWDAEWTLNPNVSAGVSVLLPIGVLSAGPFVKGSWPVAPDVHFGVYASSGFFVALGGGGDSAGYLQVGPLVTFGDEKSAFTIGEMNFLPFAKGGATSMETLNLSGFHSFSPKLKGILEAYIPFLVTGKDFSFALVGYGVRYGGDSISADIGFVMPFFDGMSGLLQYLPLGIPFIALNMIW